MSNKLRNGITIVMLIFLAITAFVAGYFANDIVASRNGSAFAQEEFDIFWEAWGRVENSFIGELPGEKERAYAAIRGSMQELGDPYTIFVEPVARQREREQLEGIFGGIGAYVSRPEDGGAIVLDPIPGNPAEAAGIVTGDVLQAVDGTPISAEMTVADVADLVKGEKGSAVILTILHPGETDPVEISVIRGDILIPSVVYRLLDEDEKIGYIRLSRFSGESGEEVAEAVQDLQRQGAEQFIFDLRQNRGGLLNAAVDISDLFLNESIFFLQP